MAHLRDLKEEIKDVKRDQEYLLRCRITDDQYQMLDSIQRRKLDKFKYLMTRGVDPAFYDDKGNMPLHIVTSLKHSTVVHEILEILVYFGTSLEAVNRFGQTPLHLSCSNSAETVKVLLQAGAKVDVQDHAGRTPLMEACSSDAPDALTTVQYLLDHNCNIFLKDQDGHTPLHCVCMNTKQDLTVRNEIAFKLLYGGLSATTEDKTGKMALCYELSNFLNKKNKKPITDLQLQLTSTLVRAGSGFNRKNKQHQRFIKYACNISSGLMFVQIARVFRPTLSVHSVNALKECVPVQDEEHVELYSYISDVAQTVKPLKFICRIAVREELKGKLFTKVDLLPIPRTLKDYLILAE